MTLLPIDKGIPLPIRFLLKNPAYWPKKPQPFAHYPWRQTKVGDSFFAPGRLIGTPREGFGCLNCKVGEKAAPGTRWASEARLEDGVIGTRVWRVG